MNAVVGLGNPGPRYANTRHNLGFRVIETLATRLAVRLSPRGAMLAGQGRHERHELLLVEPLTFMNRSGAAVAELWRGGQFRSGELIVVHDDLDLSLGTVRVKVGGGHGGHNGLRSILEETDGLEFIRVRLGIGREPARDTADWVLSEFAEEEEETVTNVVERGAEAVLAILDLGPGRAMTEVNRRRPARNPPADGDSAIMACRAHAAISTPCPARSGGAARPRGAIFARL